MEHRHAGYHWIVALLAVVITASLLATPRSAAAAGPTLFVRTTVGRAAIGNAALPMEEDIISDCGRITCTFYVSRDKSEQLYDAWQTGESTGVEALLDICSDLDFKVARFVGMCRAAVKVLTANIKTALGDAHKQQSCFALKIGATPHAYATNGKYCHGQPPATSVTESVSCDYRWPRTLQTGARGEDVKELQRRLQTGGYDLGRYGVDGDFGQVTNRAVRAFQAAKHLQVDGIVGLKTQAALNKVCP